MPEYEQVFAWMAKTDNRNVGRCSQNWPYQNAARYAQNGGNPQIAIRHNGRAKDICPWFRAIIIFACCRGKAKMGVSLNIIAMCRNVTKEDKRMRLNRKRLWRLWIQRALRKK